MVAAVRRAGQSLREHLPDRAPVDLSDPEAAGRCLEHAGEPEQLVGDLSGPFGAGDREQSLRVRVAPLAGHDRLPTELM